MGSYGGTPFLPISQQTNIPGAPNSGTSPFSNFSFGMPGSMFGGMNLTGVAAGTQAQPSGGFNTIPGMPGMPNMPGNSTGNSPFTALGLNNQNPFTLFSGNAVPGAGGSGPAGNGLPTINANGVLSSTYGQGISNWIQQFLNSGAGFNSGVIQAEQNAAMPLEANALANMGNMFGSNGLASSSTAALGYSNFESQFQSQLENMFAGQYEQSIQNALGLMSNVMGGAQATRAQQPSLMSMLSAGANEGTSLADWFMTL